MPKESAYKGYIRPHAVDRTSTCVLIPVIKCGATRLTTVLASFGALTSVTTVFKPMLARSRWFSFLAVNSLVQRSCSKVSTLAS